MSGNWKWFIAIVLGIPMSMAATAIFDLRLPVWLQGQQQVAPVEQMATIDWWKTSVLFMVVGGIGLFVLLLVGAAYEVKEPSRYDYTRDEFFGLIWRWRYGPQNQIWQPACFCPRCDRQLSATEIDRWPSVVALNCNVHGEQHRVTGDFEYFVSEARIEIQRKLRNGEWKHMVERERVAATSERAE